MGVIFVYDTTRQSTLISMTNWIQLVQEVCIFLSIIKKFNVVSISNNF